MGAGCVDQLYLYKTHKEVVCLALDVYRVAYLSHFRNVQQISERKLRSTLYRY